SLPLRRQSAEVGSAQDPAALFRKSPGGAPENCPIRSPMDASMKVEIALKVLLVAPTCQPIHPRCSILLEFKECLFEVINTDVVEERGELLLLPLPCSLPYALQRLGHAHPVLRPARSLLARISLGLRPWLRRLRSGSLRLVRRLPSYYGGV